MSSLLPSRGFIGQMSNSDSAQSRKTRLAVPSGADTMSSPTSGGDNSESGGLGVGVGVGGVGVGVGVGGGSGVGSGIGSGVSGVGIGSMSSRQNLLSQHRSQQHLQQHHFNFGGGYPSMGSGNYNGPMQYLSRLLDFRQMDIQSALDQMKTLLSTRAQVVYKTSYYRKQTKNHWARDDPAFVAIQAIFLLLASIAYAVAFRISILGSISFIIASVAFNWLALGFFISTVCREIANRHLTVHSSSSHVRQSVEWLYAFDIHCNAFFPVFVLLYGIQFFLLPLVLGDSFVALLLSNTLYVCALSWYWYITHLGYRSLPFLSNTEVFLFPIVAILFVYVCNFIGYPFGLGWNASRTMAEFYFT